MNSKPKVSICVSVYNNEQYLSYFLDSALQQSFDDYEIVIAENHSTDNSMPILQKYAAAYPDKIFLYQTNEHGGAGKGRNTAFQKSRGDYIYWCDSDDMILPAAIEKLYDEAVKYEADLVVGWAFKVIEENGSIIDVFPNWKKKNMKATNEQAIRAHTHFWMRLIKRELVEEIGSMPEDVIFEDARYLAVMQSYAKNIRFLDFPVYYYFLRSSGTTSVVRKELCEDTVLADKYVLANGNPEYITSLQHYVAMRNSWQIENYWQGFDIFVKWIHECAEWFYDNELIKNDSHVFEKLRWADGLANIDFPNIIYVNGFGVMPTEQRLKELTEKVFHDGCKIVILSKKNCDVYENKYVQQAYENGKIDLVCSYFALKNIFENGGVFIHNNIKILNYFGYLKYQNAFFSLIDKNTYSEWIYGAPAGNEAIENILKTYSNGWDKKEEYMSLAERIAIVLTAKYQIPLDGKARMFRDVVSVLPPNHSVVDTRFGSTTRMCAFEHDYSAHAGEDNYVTIPRDTLRVLMTQTKPNQKNMLRKSQREIALDRELSEIKSSNLWKLMQKLKRIGDGPCGPFLKKVFHGLLKVRAKFKK